MEAELIELYESAKKAADAAAGDGVEESSPEEDRCVDALRQLKKFPVNYQLLVSTQVCVCVCVCVFFGYYVVN